MRQQVGVVEGEMSERRVLKARVCAFCGKSGGTVAFSLPIRWLREEHPELVKHEGWFGHPRCLGRANKMGRLLTEMELAEEHTNAAEEQLIAVGGQREKDGYRLSLAKLRKVEREIEDARRAAR